MSTRRLGARRRLRTAILVALAGAVAVPIAAPPVPAMPADEPGRQPAATRAPVPELSWTACRGADAFPPGVHAECAVALVPADHQLPDGAQVGLAVKRIRATGARTGTLFVNFGGPPAGDAGVLHDLITQFTPEVRASFDVIGFDQRGNGDSTPALSCERVPPTVEPPLSADPAAWLPRVEAQTPQAHADAACVVADAPFVQSLGSVAAARDLDLLRQAVGDERLYYYGLSYGTRVGSVYAQLFPDRVAAMVLDGMVDPFADEPEIEERGAAFDDVFAAFRAWSPQAGAEFDAIVAELAKGPVNGENLASFLDIYAFLSSDNGWPMTAYGLHVDYERIVERKPQSLEDPGRPGTRVRTGAHALPGRDPARLNPWVYCQDNPTRPSDLAYAQSAAGQVVAGPLFGFVAGARLTGCRLSAVPVDAIPRDTTLQTTPLLLLHARHDANTPYSWGLAMRSTAPNGSRLVTYEGGEHGLYVTPKLTCARTLVDAYLLTGSLPATDASCPFVPPPPYIPPTP